MFGQRRRYGRRGGGGGGFGLFLLGLQLINFFSFLSRSNEFFPATLGLLAVNIAAYLRPGRFPWPSIREACISFKGVCLQREWKRVIFSPFVHASDIHLYYNMASFMWKAISLERHYGSGYFLYMVGVFSAATGALYLAINYALAEVMNQWSYVNSCAVGFSGVIFALKVVTTHLQPHGMTRIMGLVPVPMKLACWVELIIISVLFPNVSFVGHLAGILVGLAFVSGPLKTIMDIPLTFANGKFGHFWCHTYCIIYVLVSTVHIIPAATGTHGRHGRERSYTYQASATGTTRLCTNDDSCSRSHPQTYLCFNLTKHFEKIDGAWGCG